MSLNTDGPVGVRRSQELENLLSEVLDMYDRGEIAAPLDEEAEVEEELCDLMDYARQLLDREELDTENN